MKFFNGLFMFHCIQNHIFNVDFKIEIFKIDNFLFK